MFNSFSASCFRQPVHFIFSKNSSILSGFAQTEKSLQAVGGELKVVDKEKRSILEWAHQMICSFQDRSFFFFYDLQLAPYSLETFFVKWILERVFSFTILDENGWYRMHSQHSVHSAPGSRMDGRTRDFHILAILISKKRALSLLVVLAAPIQEELGTTYSNFINWWSKIPCRPGMKYTILDWCRDTPLHTNSGVTGRHTRCEVVQRSSWCWSRVNRLLASCFQ